VTVRDLDKMIMAVQTTIHSVSEKGFSNLFIEFSSTVGFLMNIEYLLKYEIMSIKERKKEKKTMRAQHLCKWIRSETRSTQIINNIW
jgi:hypothetical protein